MKKLNSSFRGAARFLLPVLCVIFIGLMTVMVLQQVPEGSFMEAQAGQFTAFMCITAALLMGLSLWSILADVNMLGLISAVGILVCMGSCYQFLFDDYVKYCRTMYLMLAAALIAYHIWRRMNVLSDWMYWLVVVAILLLLGANVVLGEEAYGAKQAIVLGSISFHPGEFVKVLLIVLGASSYHNTKRSLIYCGLCLFSCAVLILWIKDMGGMLVIFAMFMMMTYLLLDDRRLSIGITIVAIAACFVAFRLVDVVQARVGNWFHAMEPGDATYQQRSFITAILYGGFDGLGLAESWRFTRIFAAEHDGALAGILGVYGFFALFLTVCAYSVILALPAHNSSVAPSGYLILAQLSMYIFAQVVLNMGSMDILPFTGLVAPVVSEGLNAGICFGLLLGLCAAALHPKVNYNQMKEE